MRRLVACQVRSSACWTCGPHLRSCERPGACGTSSAELRSLPANVGIYKPQAASVSVLEMPDDIEVLSAEALRVSLDPSMSFPRFPPVEAGKRRSVCGGDKLLLPAHCLRKHLPLLLLRTWLAAVSRKGEKIGLALLHLHTLEPVKRFVVRPLTGERVV